MVLGSQYLDENNDIVFVMDLLKTNDYSFINKLEDMAYKEAYLQTEIENVKAKIK